ncbi:hypothetical protein ASF09_01335 [Sphingomonas sp. Leaf242]|nr:hypothetical protein ASF09_01335 [Sphingomonas sp. Leaf242]
MVLVLPPPIVILTKVRTQGYGVRRLGLWVLTFVRMTDGGMTVGIGNGGSATGAWPTGVAKPPPPVIPDSFRYPTFRTTAAIKFGGAWPPEAIRCDGARVEDSGSA